MLRVCQQELSIKLFGNRVTRVQRLACVLAERWRAILLQVHEKLIVGLLLLWRLQRGLPVRLKEILQVTRLLNRTYDLLRATGCLQQQYRHVGEDQILNLLCHQKV